MIKGLGQKVLIVIGVIASLFLLAYLIYAILAVVVLSTSSKKKTSDDKITHISLLTAVNKEREKKGVPPLTIDERLNKSAQIKADDMKKRGYFGHKDPEGKQGYEYMVSLAPECTVGSENITDSGLPEYNTLQAGISAWVNSPSHHSAMVDPRYTATGFGITSTGIVEHFCQLP